MISGSKKRLKKLPIVTFILVTALCNLVSINISYADTQYHYKSLDDFINLVPTKTSDPLIFRAHFKAQEKINDRQSDSTYENNKWHLVMRRGLYKAQVDKTISEIEQYLMNYSADEDIVQDKDDYYIARRDFTHFKHWHDAISIQENGSYTINGFTLHSDGTLTKDGITKKFTGLASLVYLNEFFANSDAGNWNYGFQETDNEIRAISYDNENAFDFDNKNPDTLDSLHLDTVFVTMKNMPWYIQERDAMVKKLAQDDFTTIEAIIRKNITGTKLDEARFLISHKQQTMAMLHYNEDGYNEALKKCLSISSDTEQKKYGVSNAINILKEKHLELQNEFRHG